MAVVETWYRCPVCSASHDTHNKAVTCRNKHPVMSEQWAVSSTGKAARIEERRAPGSYGSREWALREAELSDSINERERQLAAMKGSDHK